MVMQILHRSSFVCTTRIMYLVVPTMFPMRIMMTRDSLIRTNRTGETTIYPLESSPSPPHRPRSLPRSLLGSSSPPSAPPDLSLTTTTTTTTTTTRTRSSDYRTSRSFVASSSSSLSSSASSLSSSSASASAPAYTEISTLRLLSSQQGRPRHTVVLFGLGYVGSRLFTHLTALGYKVIPYVT